MLDRSPDCGHEDPHYRQLEQMEKTMAEHNQQFETYVRWVNKASSWLTRYEGTAICFDMKGRQCKAGKDFMRARDEDCFPVRWIWDWQAAGYFGVYSPDEFQQHLDDANDAVDRSEAA